MTTVTRPANKPRQAPMRVTVAEVRPLTPRLLRVTFTGAELSRFTWPGPGSHFKVYIPEPGADDVVLPEPDEDGMVRFAPGAVPTMRTYTPRAFDAERGRLDVDFVLHGHGPAATWAATARPGSRTAVGPAKSRYDLDPSAAGLVLAGDESALPGIGTILRARPAGLPVRVLVEVEDETDQLAVADGVEVTWLPRYGQPAGSQLAPTLGKLAIAAGERVWVATEALVVRQIRGDLLAAGVPREALVTRGYWRAGVANHPDHDFGDERMPTR